jgi:hypothetical protein
LVNDGDDAKVREPGLSIVRRILAGDPLFHSLFQLAKSYPLPDGDTVYLYRRTAGPGHPLDYPQQVEGTRAVANAIRAAWSGHSQLIYADPDLAVWVGLHDPAGERVTVLGMDDRAVDERLQPLTGTLLAVLSHGTDEVQAWLDAHGYRTLEVGDDFASVAIYGRPAQPLQAMPVNVAWPDIQLAGLASLPAVAPGAVLPLETALSGAPAAESKWSVRLVDRDGRVIASHDRPLTPADRFGLFVPPDTSPGRYDVVAIRYDPTTGATLPTIDGTEQARLMQVEIVDSESER